jgi:hypothetical protein
VCCSSLDVSGALSLFSVQVLRVGFTIVGYTIVRGYDEVEFSPCLALEPAHGGALALPAGLLVWVRLI